VRVRRWSGTVIDQSSKIRPAAPAQPRVRDANRVGGVANASVVSGSVASTTNTPPSLSTPLASCRRIYLETN
jgi:hypothetical protein